MSPNPRKSSQSHKTHQTLRTYATLFLWEKCERERRTRWLFHRTRVEGRVETSKVRGQFIEADLSAAELPDTFMGIVSNDPMGLLKCARHTRDSALRNFMARRFTADDSISPPSLSHGGYGETDDSILDSFSFLFSFNFFI